MSACQTQRREDELETWPGMEELLLPSSEEEARSDHGSYVPGDAGRTMGDRVKSFLLGAVKEDLRRKVRDFCRKNGLLTLSLVAVLTGCTLGFMLRGTQLSTQVRLTCLDVKL